jgi:hypothetical protein
MADSPKKPPTGLDRRRASRIVHDERGNARVEWIDIDDEREHLFDRTALSIDGESPPAPEPDKRKPGALAVERPRAGGFNPYQGVGTAGRPADKQPQRSTKRDLRKLGEWLKIKREVEERRARGETDDE